MLIANGVSPQCSERGGCSDFLCREGDDLVDCTVGGLRVGSASAGIRVMEKGFLPCLISFAVMDFVVLPQVRHR